MSFCAIVANQIDKMSFLKKPLVVVAMHTETSCAHVAEFIHFASLFYRMSGQEALVLTVRAKSDDITSDFGSHATLPSEQTVCSLSSALEDSSAPVKIKIDHASDERPARVIRRSGVNTMAKFFSIATTRKSLTLLLQSIRSTQLQRGAERR